MADTTNWRTFMTHFNPKEILLATNGENLKHFITSGFIHPREGFKKYYRDISHSSPGHLPLFIDSIVPSLLQECQEEPHIDIVILSLRLPLANVLDRISYYIDENNVLVSGAPALDEKDAKAQIVYYKGVIPTSAIATVFFKSSVEKKRFLAYDYSNFKPTMFKLNIGAKFFKEQKSGTGEMFNEQKATVESTFIQKPVPDYTAYLAAHARGALLSMLKHGLPPVPESNALINLVTQPSPQENPVLNILPRQLEHLKDWIWGKIKSIDDVDGILLYHVLDLLASSDPLKGLTSVTFLNDLENLLENNKQPLTNHLANPSINYEGLKQRFRKRFEEIQQAVDQHIEPSIFFNDKTLKSNIMRALLLFLIRLKRVPEFYKEKDLIEEWSISGEDLLFANIFYAVWQGWQLMNDELRPGAKKEIFVITDFMADWFNKTQGGFQGCFSQKTNLKVSGSSMLWEKKILKNIPWKINQPLGKFAINMAKERNWDSITSEIVIEEKNISKMSYEKKNNTNISITIAGDFSLKERLDKNIFLEQLDEIELTDNEIAQFKKLYSN